MNFLLSDLEKYVSESALLLGEELLEQGGVRNLQEVEKHLWLAEVHDSILFEVELRITPTKIAQGSCECTAFRPGDPCGHFVAAALALRRRIQEKKVQNQQKSPAEKKASKSLGTQQILEHVNHAELAEFVRSYAKNNRGFAIALKSRFATTVPVEDPKAKFNELLDSAISAARKADRSFSNRGLRKIIEVTDEMGLQMRQSAELKHFSDTVGIAQSLIEKLTPLLRKSGELEPDLRRAIRESFKVLREFVSPFAPPVLSDALRVYAIEEYRKLLYRNNAIDKHFLRLLEALIRTPEDTVQLRELLSEQIERYLMEGRDPAPMVLQLIQLLEKEGQRVEATALLERYLSSPEVLLFAAKNAAAKSDRKKMTLLCEFGLKLQMPPAVHAELEILMLENAKQEQNLQQIAHFAKSRFLKTLDITYFRTFLTGWNGDTDALEEQILTPLRKLPFSTAKRQAIAGVLSETGRYDDLLSYLNDCRSLELLSAFGHYFLPDRQEEIANLYKELFAQYLRSHVGPKPSKRIREILDELRRRGGGLLADRLVAIIKEAYPERNSLKDALGVQFNMPFAD
jgi:hypothetical protein